MKKFTKLNEHVVQKETSFEDVIDLLLEDLTIEIESETEEKVLENDFKIKANDKFYSGIKTVLNKIYNQDKKVLLEKIRTSLYTKNISWVDDEIEKINESLKK